MDRNPGAITKLGFLDVDLGSIFLTSQVQILAPSLSA